MKNVLNDRDYNKELRGQILICSVREEEAASNVLKYLLRLIKPDSKTLNNKSSSLSFKNKIDLLYDIDDLTKDEYNALIRFMEIRNQFIHNPNCSSFENLGNEAPELSKYLSTNFKNEIVEIENSLSESFKNLFIRTLGKLLVLSIEYRKGATNEMLRYVDSKAIQNFDSIFNAAYNHWKSNRPSLNPLVFPIFNNSDKEVKDFERYLKYYLLEEQIKNLDQIINDEVTEKDIFQRKAELLADYKKEKSQLEELNNTSQQ
jgi:hypothetical protein